jgi:deoxyribodipyrimidine photo-lyase
MYFFWFRRDLRIHDNAGLYHALKQAQSEGEQVQCLFIFDKNILDELTDPTDARLDFIHQQLLEIDAQLREHGSSLLVKHGTPEQVWWELSESHPIKAVFTNRDYEPYALSRDQRVSEILTEKNAVFHTFKDHVLFEKDEVLKNDGTPYTVFTPYSRKWKEKLVSRPDAEAGSFYLKSYPSESYLSALAQDTSLGVPDLAEIGFEKSKLEFPPKEVSRGLIRQYGETRNFPAVDGTSKLGVHFRFGTISIRAKARAAQGLSEVYLNELIWRDFYSQILAHFPHVVEQSFRPQYDRIEWRNNPDEFEAWCAGCTGYPLVDAGMRELAQTGYMHNRVRMVVASFLCKHLLIDWRWGEAWFAQKLLDFDLASNNGGWQWAAGSGTDAAPYFRIFNPSEQLKKFDSKLVYVKKWVPEYGTTKYAKPIVEHVFARKRCLDVYQRALK